MGRILQDTLADGALNWLPVSEVLSHDVSLEEGSLLLEDLSAVIAIADFRYLRILII